MADETAITIFKALADKTRLEVVRELAKSVDCVSCRKVSSASSLSQPAMSHHLSKLVDAKIVVEEKNGKEKHYSLNQELLKAHGINPEKI